LTSSQAHASILSLGQTTHKRASEHRAVDLDEEEVWWPHDYSYVKVRHLCAAQNHAHAHTRSLQDPCSHSSSYIYHSFQSRVLFTQDCSGLYASSTRSRPNAPSCLRCAHAWLTQHLPCASTRRPYRAPRCTRCSCPRPSTAPALAENPLPANGRTRDDTPEPLHAPYAPSQAAAGATIPHVVAVRALDLPVRPSGFGSRSSLFRTRTGSRQTHMSPRSASSTAAFSIQLWCSTSRRQRLAESQSRPCSMFWAAPNGASDPAAALERHLELNAPPADGPLFACDAGVRVTPMTHDRSCAKLH
jgi:hypothetical protein